MTLAEGFLFVVACAAIYFALRPMQRWLEVRLSRILRRGYSRTSHPTIDVTDFRSRTSRKKDDDEYEHGA